MEKFLRIGITALTIALSLYVFGRMAWPNEVVERPAATPPIPIEQWDDETRIWLARSLVGEAGWTATKEHAAIAFVYANRWKQSGKSRSFLGLVRTYSAAVKGRSNARHPWLHHLNEEGDQPDGWAVGRAYWPNYRDRWLNVLAWTDGWAAGYFDNPCPRANHYGGYVDDRRARAAGWYRVRCEHRMRNRFYDSRRRAKRRNVIVPFSPAWHRLQNRKQQ